MINLSQGQTFDEHYQLVRLIDTGGYAEVWEARYLVAGNTVALKIYPRLDEEGAATIESEYKQLFELQHSNLVNALHFGRFQNYPYLVMRYYPGGNASGKIGDCHEAEIAKMFLQIGGVLKYLHANDLVHQDIKPNNFLLDARDNYYLADLGLSAKVRATIRRYTLAGSSDKGMVASKQTGLTPAQYRAPELFDQQRAHDDPIKATDIWALGASAYEMITGRAPFGELGGLMQRQGDKLERLPAVYSDELNQLIEECLAKDAWDRPTASKLEKRAQSFLETAKWYEPEEWEQLIRKKGESPRTDGPGSRKTVRHDENDPYRGGQGAFGGGGGQGGGQQGGTLQGGQGGTQQGTAIKRDTKNNARTGIIAVAVAIGLVVVAVVLGNRVRHSTAGNDTPKVDTTTIVRPPVADGGTGTAGGGTGGAGTAGGTGGGGTGGAGTSDGGTGGTGTAGGKDGTGTAGGTGRTGGENGNGGNGGATGKDRTNGDGTKTGGADRTKTGGTDGGSTGAGSGSSANYLDVKYPAIDTKPRGECPTQLTRIVRNGNTIKAWFFVPGCSGKLSLYGPGDPRALFVRPNGQTDTYPLTAISWTGSDVAIPSSGLNVVATFRCPPSEYTLLDIKEDANRLDQGLSFITFKGIHLQ
jgi:hypothetical protein